MTVPKKFKTVLNNSPRTTNEEIEVPANILKHLYGSKSLCQCVKKVYDFATILN